MKYNGVSIVICCYNSENRISKTISAILKIQSRWPFEVILVDNNCADNTVALVRQLWQSSATPVTLKVIEEKRPGLIFAREAGTGNAGYDITLFCDDDNHLMPDYLDLAMETFLSDEKIGAVGGLGTAISSADIPHWFKKYQHAYACGPQAAETGNATEPYGQLYGAGICIKTKLLHEIFSSTEFVSSGRTGKAILSGEDSEICFNIILRGYELFYNDKMLFFHEIEGRRLSWEYLHKLYVSFGKAHYHLYPLEQQALKKIKCKRMKFRDLVKYWKKDFKYALQYCIKGASYSGTVKGAWLIGLTKAYCRNIF